MRERATALNTKDKAENTPNEVKKVNIFQVSSLIPSPYNQLAQALLYATIVILVVEIVQNTAYFIRHWQEITIANVFSKFEFDLDFWGFTFGIATFIIGLIITASLEEEQDLDNERLTKATDEIHEATKKIIDSTKELLENQRKSHNSFFEVLEKAQAIVDKSNELKVMTFTTTFGFIYGNDPTEVDLIAKKNMPQIDLTDAESQTIRSKIAEDLKLKIDKLTSDILKFKNLELLTYCDCPKGCNVISEGFLNNIYKVASKPESCELVLENTIERHKKNSIEINAKKQSIKHIKITDKIPLQMFVGKNISSDNKHLIYQECLVIFENLGDSQHHILAFSSINEQIVEFFESMFNNTVVRHNKCDHKQI